MNKHELLKQADYNFQRGNRALAKQYLSEVLQTYPNEAAAWMLLARIEQDTKRRAEYFERVLKFNPNNNEAMVGLARSRAVSPTLPPPDPKAARQERASRPAASILRGLAVTAVFACALGAGTYVFAKNNPTSPVAQFLIEATPTPLIGALPADVAAQTRAELHAKYPQYSPLVDTLIGLALEGAENGMDGAPPRPGAEIIPFDGAAESTRAKFENALPQPGSLSSITLNEQQVTSWMAQTAKNNADLPLSDVQVYLRDDKIQIWGMVNGNGNSTSALIVGQLATDSSNHLTVQLESIQFGKRTMPDFIVSQGSAWLNQWLTEQVDAHLPGLQIMNIHISNGLITLSGMR